MILALVPDPPRCGSPTAGTEAVLAPVVRSGVPWFGRVAIIAEVYRLDGTVSPPEGVVSVATTTEVPPVAEAAGVRIEVGSLLQSQP
jgi:hypothetical protein